MNENTGAKALPIQDKAFLFTANLTLSEYLDTLSVQRPLLRTRMAEVRLPTDKQDFLVTYPDILNLLLVVSEDAPETAIILPIIERIVAASPRLVLRVIRDTDDLSGLEATIDDLDLGEDSETDLPLLLIFDEEWNWREQWGPRPEAAEPRFDRWIETHPAFEQLSNSDEEEDQDAYWQLAEQLLQEMRVWYNSGLDQECIGEICALLEAVGEENEE